MAKLKDLPIRVLMGYMPEVGERDARAFALGIAEKNNESSEISYYGVFAFDRGFIYEVHEGGDGKAFGPSIIKYFKENAGRHTQDNPVQAIVPASSRKLLVERAEDGIHCLLLPESDDRMSSEWLATSTLLAPAVAKKTGMLVTGAIIFSMGMLSVLGAMFSRYQPYEPPPVIKPEKVDVSGLPFAQWPKVLQAQSQGYVSSLEFENNKWEVKTKTEEELAAPAPSANMLPPPLPGSTR